MVESDETALSIGQAFEFCTTLLKFVKDHGGDVSDMMQIVKQPELAAANAQLLVKDLWAFVNEPFQLEVDWETPERTFIRMMEDRLPIGSPIKRSLTFPLFEENPAPRTDSYILLKFRKPVMFTDMISLCKERNCSPAGFRELCAFADLVIHRETVAQDARFLVLAPGSEGPSTENRPNCSLFRRWSDGVMGIHRGEAHHYNEPFNQEWSFLVYREGES